MKMDETLWSFTNTPLKTKTAGVTQNDGPWKMYLLILAIFGIYLKIVGCIKNLKL